MDHEALTNLLHHLTILDEKINQTAARQAALLAEQVRIRRRLKGLGTGDDAEG